VTDSNPTQTRGRKRKKHGTTLTKNKPKRKKGRNVGKDCKLKEKRREPT